MAFRFTVASSSVWPPLKNTMAAISGGTVLHIVTQCLLGLQLSTCHLQSIHMENKPLQYEQHAYKTMREKGCYAMCVLSEHAEASHGEHMIV